MNLNFFNYHLHSRRASLRLTRFRVNCVYTRHINSSRNDLRP